MLVEQRTYTFRPGTVPRFLALYEEQGLAIQSSILGSPLAYFTSEFGELNQTVHLWAYESLEDRQQRRTKLFADPQWLSFFEQITPMLVKQESKLLLPTRFASVFGK
jgi:hypothetical protein